MKFLSLELRRLLTVNKLIYLIIGCILLKVVLLFFIPEMKDPRIKSSRKQYDYYLEQLYGEDTEEKQQFIQTEYDQVRFVLGQYNQMRDDHMMGILSNPEWKEFLERYELAQMRFPAISIFKEKLDQFYLVYPYDSIDPPQYFYDYGWKTYFSYLAFPDVLALLGMILVAVQIFGGDIASGTVNLLRSTRDGKGRLFLCRSLLCVVSSVLLSAVHAGMEYLIFSFRMSLNDAFTPLYSLPNFAGVDIPISIIGGLLAVYLFRAVGTCLISLFVLYFSILLRNMVAALCCTVAAVTLPLLLTGLPGGMISYTYTGFLTGVDVIKNYVHFHNLFFWLLPLLLLLGISLILFFSAGRIHRDGPFYDV